MFRSLIIRDECLEINDTGQQSEEKRSLGKKLLRIHRKVKFSKLHRIKFRPNRTLFRFILDNLELHFGH
jgi:hypothetical protein